MSGRAVVDLLGPVSSLWVGAGATRTLVLADPLLGPNNEVGLMVYVDVIVTPEGGAAGRDLTVTTGVRTYDYGGTVGIVRNLYYVVQNRNQSSGTFFNRMAILARFAANP